MNTTLEISPTLELVRIAIDGRPRWAARTAAGGALLDLDLDSLLQMPLAQARATIDAVSMTDPIDGALLAPVDSQEVWGAGVTYERSREGRKEESSQGAVYDQVYAARRPEVFFKSVAARVVGDGDRDRDPGRLTVERPGARARPGAQLGR